MEITIILLLGVIAVLCVVILAFIGRIEAAVKREIATNRSESGEVAKQTREELRDNRKEIREALESFRWDTSARIDQIGRASCRERV